MHFRALGKGCFETVRSKNESSEGWTFSCHTYEITYETFMGRSITTAMWKVHLYEYWAKYGGEEKIKALNSVD